ncbi:MAG TPA: cytochrome D1 domain-containing protein [Longimicrobium sp.]|nr:cytochrome D1 domain-containing protein [Longimicrobium sp.]
MPSIPRRFRVPAGAAALAALATVAGGALPNSVFDAHAFGDCARPAAAPRAAAARLPAASAGRLLVANQRSGSATIVDLATGAATHLRAAEEPHGAAVSPDGRWGVVTDYGRRNDGNTLVVIDMARKRVARTIGVGRYRAVHDVAFVPGSNTRVVVTAQATRHVIEVDLAGGRVLGAAATRADGSHSLALAPDGRTLFTANEQAESVSQIDLPARGFVAHLPVGSNPLGLDVARGGREVWVGTREGGVVRVIDVARRAVVAEIPGVEFADDIVLTPDGRRAAITDLRCGVVHVADVAGRRLLGAIPLARPAKVVVAPDSRTAFVTLARENSVAVVDLETRRVLARHRTQRTPDGVAWGPALRQPAPRPAAPRAR